MNEYIRNCPICKKELKYKNAQSFCNAKRLKPPCRKCGKTKKFRDALKKTIESNKSKGKFKGENNPMYGKRHSDKLQKQINENLKKYYENNPGTMTGKNFYNCWVNKYGKEIADKKLIEFKNKQSINSKGENNPMYGKPSPMGSGNGWSGWYKNFYFRSLLELSFMFENDGKYKTCESKDFKIKYIINDVEKNYYPDFIIGNTVYEIKPKKLWNTIVNKIKFQEAEKWCKKNNYNFKIIEPKKLIFEKIKQLVDNNEVVFIERYKIKYNQKLNAL